MDYVSLFSADFVTIFAVFILPASGVVTLVLVARALGFKGQPELRDAADAATIATDALVGFRAAETVIDAAGRAALVRAGDGRIALIRPHGDRWVIRVANSAAAAVDGPRLTVAIAEPLFSPVTLDLGKAAPHWATSLGT